MAAAATDKLKKLSRRWVGQIGSGGVADENATTVPLSSTTNLPTDTAVVAVIDRIDVNGTATPTLEETIIGVVSGSNLINCIRGAEGTAQAHSAGAVVEILFTAKGWNDLIDHLLVEHNQDGTHKETALDSIITGSEASGTMIYHNGSAWVGLAKGDASQQLRMNSGATAPEWFTPTAAASFWTAFTGAYASGTTITVATDLTGLFKKGVILKWLSSADAFKTGMVISSSYSAPNTTITIVGSTVESGDKSFYYAGEMANKVTFIVPGNQSTGTDVSKTWFNPTPIYKLSVDAYNKTAGTTGNTVYDLNINGSTAITTKPTIASAGTSDIDNVCDTPATVVAAGSAFTVDIDTATTTQAVDGYIDLFYFPQSWVSLT